MAVSIKSLWTKAFAAACSVLTVAFAVLAVIGWFEPRYSFMFSLIFSFFAWLFLFHAIFGFANLLSAAQARAIDYVYLGVAAVGVFVLAFNYEGRRQDYDASEQAEKLADDLNTQKVEVGKYLLRLDFALCGRKNERPFPVHCDLLDKVDWGFPTAETKEDASKLTVDEFLEKLPPAPAGKERDFSIEVQQYIEPLQYASNRQNAAAEALKNHKERMKARERDVRDESHGLFTWPFILAFAFALRLTRTTIEVFDWTRRPSPAPQTN